MSRVEVPESNIELGHSLSTFAGNQHLTIIMQDEQSEPAVHLGPELEFIL